MDLNGILIEILCDLNGFEWDLNGIGISVGPECNHRCWYSFLGASAEIFFVAKYVSLRCIEKQSPFLMLLVVQHQKDVFQALPWWFCITPPAKILLNAVIRDLGTSGISCWPWGFASNGSLHGHFGCEGLWFSCSWVCLKIADEVPKMEVSINGGTPKWMVFVRENPIKVDDLGVHLF